ncbi:MAG: R3H domain-containing nucleic acid-binding protein [bacterium]|nr:R3H domain-containing nucleic acid-binding protein [bacterium]
MAEPNTKEIIEELLKLMNVGFEAIERVESPESNHTRFLIRTDESALLIGQNGEHLGAFNYIIRRIAAKSALGEAPEKFFVDVNGYHEKTLENLKAKAKIMCERARSFKVDIELDPMSSYERMIIHSFLEGAVDIKTESKGEGAQRRVVIKYISS